MQRARSMLRCSLFSRFLLQSYGKKIIETRNNATSSSSCCDRLCVLRQKGDIAAIVVARRGLFDSFYSSISSSKRLLQRYFFVSWAATPLSSNRAMRLGMVIRAFMQSAMFQMMSRLMMLPKNRATIYRMR